MNEPTDRLVILEPLRTIMQLVYHLILLSKQNSLCKQKIIKLHSREFKFNNGCVWVLSTKIYTGSKSNGAGDMKGY